MIVQSKRKAVFSLLTYFYNMKYVCSKQAEDGF